MRIEAAGGSSRRRLVSLTPLIDVVFILLVFFMLVSSFVEWRVIRLDGPVRTEAPASVRSTLVIRVHRDGRLDMEGDSVNLSALAGRVDGWVEQHPGQQVLVQPVGDPSVQAVVAVLDRLGRSKAGTIGLIQE